jgi:hypothetical protein
MEERRLRVLENMEQRKEGVECEDEVTARTELCSVECRSGPVPNFINYHVNFYELKLLVRFLFFGRENWTDGWSRLDMLARVGIEWASIATRYGLDRPGDRIPVGETFCSHPDRVCDPPRILYNGYRVFPGDKAAGAWR